MKAIDYTGDGICTIVEIADDEPTPKGIWVTQLDLIITAAFLAKWAGHFEREKEISATRQTKENDDE